MIKKRLLFVLSLLVFILITTTILLHQMMVDISKPYPASSHTITNQAEIPLDTIQIGVISRFPTNILYQGYQPLIDFLSDQTDYYFELVVSRSYGETVQQLAGSEVDAAFLGTYIYLISREEYDLEPILKPLNEEGSPFFHSVIITRDDSEIHSIEDLKGKRLALPSQLSYSGNWLTEHDFSGFDFTLDELAHMAYFQHHHNVVYEVMRNNFDAGTVKDRVADEFSERGVRVIYKSEPIPGSPIVVRRNHNHEISEAIRSALLRINPDDPEYSDVIDQWDPEFAYGFSRADASDYDHIRIENANRQLP